MCFLCVEIMKERITLKEAYNALGELMSSAKDQEEMDHLDELYYAIVEDYLKTEIQGDL